jgi:Domain of unknown function (DUF5666)
MVMNSSKHRTMLFIPIALLLPLALTSCGGGGGIAGSGTGGGAGGTGVGPIAGFGSVIVNGVKYDDTGIDNTNFFDDHGRNKSVLMAGMMVKISAMGIDDVQGTGIATKIEVLRHVDGPLDDNGVTLATNRMKVMGQTVVMDTTTVFDNVIDLVAVDNLAKAGKRPELEIHGIADNTGTIHATFIHKGFDNVVTGRDVQVKGRVANLNLAHTAFTLGTVSVSISPPPAGLANGLFVEAKGTFRISDNTLLATGVTIEDPTAGQGAGDLVKAEGYVNRIIAAGAQFELVSADGSQKVNWSASTTAFKDGSTADILAGARVEVEGRRNLDKTLAAKEIAFRKPSNIRMDTTVTVPASPPNSLRLFGKTVFVNSLTQYKDSRDGLPTFGLANILTGDTLRVSAFLDNSTGSDRIVASRVERIDAFSTSDRHILQGRVDLFDTVGPTYTVLGNLTSGLTVLTNGSTTSYANADGSAMTLEEFFALLAANQGAGKSTVVRARGTAAAAGTSMGAKEVEVEPTIDN